MQSAGNLVPNLPVQYVNLEDLLRKQAQTTEVLATPWVQGPIPRSKGEQILSYLDMVKNIANKLNDEYLPRINEEYATKLQNLSAAVKESVNSLGKRIADDIKKARELVKKELGADKLYELTGEVITVYNIVKLRGELADKVKELFGELWNENRITDELLNLYTKILDLESKIESKEFRNAIREAIEKGVGTLAYENPVIRSVYEKFTNYSYSMARALANMASNSNKIYSYLDKLAMQTYLVLNKIADKLTDYAKQLVTKEQ